MERLTMPNKKYYGDNEHLREMCYMGFDGDCKYPTCGGCPILELYRKLSDYEDLEEQGLLVKLPCRVGDLVYFIKSAFSMAAFPIDAKVVSIRGINCDGEVMYLAITNYNKLDRHFTSVDVGKTVFLTKESVKKALAYQTIQQYIKKCDYTYTVEDVLLEYKKYLEDVYISYTAKDCIENNMDSFKALEGKE